MTVALVFVPLSVVVADAAAPVSLALAVLLTSAIVLPVAAAGAGVAVVLAAVAVAASVEPYPASAINVVVQDPPAAADAAVFVPLDFVERQPWGYCPTARQQTVVPI